MVSESLSAEEVLALSRDKTAECLKIGYVGRIVQEQKRVLDLVPLALELVRRRVCFELYIIGEGPERRILETALEQEGLAGSVKLLGWLSPARVNEELRKLDVFVLLSDYEGLPVALLEAMGNALAPVVTRTESGNTQLVQDGKNGFTVDVGDISAFGERLQLLANDRQRLLLTRRAAWETSRHYSLERMVENYIESFQNAAGKAAERQQREGLSSRYPVMPACRSKYPAWLRKIKNAFSVWDLRISVVPLRALCDPVVPHSLLKFMLPIIRAIVKKPLNLLGLDLVRYHPRYSIGEYAYISSLKIKSVIDVGAHTGEFAKMITRILPGVAVISFEPLKEEFLRLESQLREIPQSTGAQSCPG